MYNKRLGTFCRLDHHIKLTVIVFFLDEDDLTLPVYMYEIESGVSINENMISLLSMESATPQLLKVSRN